MTIAVAQPLKVACVGDSITYGDTLPQRVTQSYPAILQDLGDGRLVVENHGVNGHTALPGTGRCWLDTPAAVRALDSQPDIVVILLGTNDSGLPYRYEEFPTAIAGIAKRFLALPSNPRVFLCTLPPFTQSEQHHSRNEAVETILNPAIRRCAGELGLGLIDLHAVYPTSSDWFLDHVHPSQAGAALIAQTVYAGISEQHGK